MLHPPPPPQSSASLSASSRSTTPHIPSLTFSSTVPSAAPSARAKSAAASSSRSHATSHHQHAAGSSSYRYDPDAVIRARRHAVRTSAPLTFQRKVHSRKKNHHNNTHKQQLLVAQHPDETISLQLNPQHQPWYVHHGDPSVWNEKVHKTQQFYFEGKQSWVHDHESISPSTHMPDSSRSILSAASSSSFSARAASATLPDPLLHYLESSWRSPDLALSMTNTRLPRSQRRTFDTPQHVTAWDSASLHVGSGGAGASNPFDPDSQVSALTLQEGHRAKSRRDRLNHGDRGRAEEERRRQREKRNHAKSPSPTRSRSVSPNKCTTLIVLEPRLIEDGGVGQPIQHVSERQLYERKTPLPQALHLAETLSHGSTLHSTTVPSPSYLMHPHSQHFRHIPHLKTKKKVENQKQERNWNTRHQVGEHADAW